MRTLNPHFFNPMVRLMAVLLTLSGTGRNFLYRQPPLPAAHFALRVAVCTPGDPGYVNKGGFTGLPSRFAGRTPAQAGGIVAGGIPPGQPTKLMARYFQICGTPWLPICSQPTIWNIDCKENSALLVPPLSATTPAI